MKKLFIGAAVLLLVLVGAGAVLYVSRDAVVKHVIEKQGTKMLGVDVSVGKVSLSLRSGEANVSDLAVGNPPGYGSKTAFKVASVHAAVDVKSIFKGKAIKLAEIDVASPKVTLEAKGRATNLATIRQNLAKQAPAPKEGKQEPGRKCEIARFRMDGAEVAVIAPQLMAGARSYAIPDLELDGIGKKDAKVTAKEAVRQIVSAVVDSAARSAGRSALEERVRGLRLPLPRQG